MPAFGWTQDGTQRNDQLPNYPELRSNYNSLQLHAEKRFHAGIYALSNFTWGKGLDEGTFGPQNIFNFSSNYGNSDTTRPWAWVSAFTWDFRSDVAAHTQATSARQKTPWLEAGHSAEFSISREARISRQLWLIMLR